MKQTTVTVNEQEYVLQHPGARASIQMIDRAKNKFGVPMDENLYGDIMKHVIVQPKVKWADFDDDLDGMRELMNKAVRFLRGKDPDEDDGDADEE